MEAPSVFLEELLNICPVVFRALYTPAVLFSQETVRPPPPEHKLSPLRAHVSHEDPDWVEMQLGVN